MLLIGENIQMKKGAQSTNKLDRVVADARSNRDERDKGYREQALKLYPWICGRCSREFTHKNLHELTVHHKDHNHDNNPSDGSNWELLCLYCHDNEHARYVDKIEMMTPGQNSEKKPDATFNPFANLKDLLNK